MSFKSFVAAVALLATGTLTFAQSIRHDLDRTAAFSRYKRFAWVRGTVLPDAINHDRIVDAGSAQLRAKGLVEVEREAAPDLYVAYHATFDRDLRISGFASGWGPYRFGGGSASARTETILTGSLAVDVIDARTKTIVYRAMATKEIDVNADPVKRERNINRAAEKLFKSYPAAE